MKKANLRTMFRTSFVGGMAQSPWFQEAPKHTKVEGGGVGWGDVGGEEDNNYVDSKRGWRREEGGRKWDANTEQL